MSSALGPVELPAKKSAILRPRVLHRPVRLSSGLLFLAKTAVVSSPPGSVNLRAGVCREDCSNVAAVDFSQPGAVELLAKTARNIAAVASSPPGSVGLEAPVPREDGHNIAAMYYSLPGSDKVRAAIRLEDGSNMAAGDASPPGAVELLAKTAGNMAAVVSSLQGSVGLVSSVPLEATAVVSAPPGSPELWDLVPREDDGRNIAAMVSSPAGSVKVRACGLP